MTPRRFESWLLEAIEMTRMDEEDSRIRDVEDFVRAGILTTNRGLVVAFEDGSEIQLTLVQSRRGSDDE